MTLALSPDVLLAGIILISLTLYVLTGGADYGAGFWTLFAYGPRGESQRRLIADAIGPIWEANHVWLILVVTILFTAFPPAFALIATRLHIPLTLMLLGIVLRGAAFVFRNHDVSRPMKHPAWEALFGIASLLTPILLGVTIGAIASGRLNAAPSGFVPAFVSPWLSAFPVVVGFLALALFALLAAVYLILETDNHTLREVFRRRALLCAVAIVILAIAALALAAREASPIYYALTHTRIRWVMIVAAGLELAMVGLLWRRRYMAVRIVAVGQVSAMVWGWGLAQYPFLVLPTVSLKSAAADSLTLQLLLGALVLGALILFPSLYYLFRLFKGHILFEDDADHH